MNSTFTRAAYTMDGQGFDFSSSYKYGSSSPSTPNAIPTAASKSFTRCHYSKDSQGVSALKYPYSTTKAVKEDETVSLSPSSSSTQFSGDDGLFRGVYDLGQRPSSIFKA